MAVVGVGEEGAEIAVVVAEVVAVVGTIVIAVAVADGAAAADRGRI